MRKSIEKRARLRGDNDFMPSVADGGDFAEFKSKRCPDCGMTEDEFTETGRLGCEYCYEAFYDLIATRTGIARGLRHTGSKPGEKRWIAARSTATFRTNCVRRSKTRITPPSQK